MSVESSRIVVVGSVNVDLVVTLGRHPQPGETVLGRSLTVSSGGKGANQAVAAARLGADVALIGAVGDDTYADAALAGLTDAGVDLSAVRRTTGSTGVAIVEVSDDGENTIVVVPGANGEVTPDLVASSAGVIAGAGVVVVQGELPAAATEAAVRIARGRVVLNPAPVIRLDRAVLMRADPLVVNEHEGALVLAQLSGDVTSGHEGVVEALLACGITSVVLTLGGAGALVSDGGPVLRVPAPQVHAVDTTGAGDAFLGALAVRLQAGETLHEAVRFAVRVGSFAVRGSGAQPSYPSLDDDLPDAALIDRP